MCYIYQAFLIELFLFSQLHRFFYQQSTMFSCTQSDMVNEQYIFERMFGKILLSLNHCNLFYMHWNCSVPASTSFYVVRCPLSDTTP